MGDGQWIDRRGKRRQEIVRKARSKHPGPGLEESKGRAMTLCNNAGVIHPSLQRKSAAPRLTAQLSPSRRRTEYTGSNRKVSIGQLVAASDSHGSLSLALLIYNLAFPPALMGCCLTCLCYSGIGPPDMPHSQAPRQPGTMTGGRQPNIIPPLPTLRVILFALTGSVIICFIIEIYPNFFFQQY